MERKGKGRDPQGPEILAIHSLITSITLHGRTGRKETYRSGGMEARSYSIYI